MLLSDVGASAVGMSDVEPLWDTCLKKKQASTTYGVSCVDAAQWEAVLADFTDISYEQSDSYMSGQWGEKVQRVLVNDTVGQVIGGALVVEIKVPMLGRGLAYVKFGPFWRRQGQPANEAHYKAIVSALKSEFCDRRRAMLSILPRPSPEFERLEAGLLETLGFKQRRPFGDPDRYLVRVLDDEAAQKKSLAQKWRYNLNKALKNGLTISQSSDDEGLATFKSLHDQMIARKKFDDVDAVDLIPQMRAQLPEGLRPHIFLAYKDNQPIAGAVVGVLGDTAYYVYGASNDQALPLKAGYALQWAIVCWLQGQGAHWYDLGGKVAEPGLHQFKKGFVGKAGEIWTMTGEMDAWSGLSGRLTGDALYAGRHLAQRVRGALKG